MPRKVYYPEEDSHVVVTKTTGLPIVFAPLHDLEFTSAMRLKVFRREATDDQVLAALQFVRDDLASGKLLAIGNLTSATIQAAIDLANQYSATTGSRSLDTLHCALAQSLKITAFLTTDARQLALARLIGLPIQKL